jgi:hypothetical protein
MSVRFRLIFNLAGLSRIRWQGFQAEEKIGGTGVRPVQQVKHKASGPVLDALDKIRDRDGFGDR